MNVPVRFMKRSFDIAVLRISRKEMERRKQILFFSSMCSLSASVKEGLVSGNGN